MPRLSSLLAILTVLPVLATSACAADSDDGVDEGQQNQEVAQEDTTLDHPLILVHGFAATKDSFSGFSPALVADLKRQWGPDFVLEVNLPAFQPPPKRAAALKAQIIEKYGPNIDRFNAKGKVNIIAHSMGGLDARYLASPNTPEKEALRWGSHIESITTISTPHRGSAIAPKLHDAFAKKNGSDVINKILAHLGAVAGDATHNANILDTLLALSPGDENTVGTARWFDKTLEDDKDNNVTYYSWAGVSSVPLFDPNPNDKAACTPNFANHHHLFAKGLGPDFARDRMAAILIPTASIIAEAEKVKPQGFSITAVVDKLDPNVGSPHDGLVQVESAKHGKFMGCIAADHADEVGTLTPNGTPNAAGYDPIDFYTRLTHDLAFRHH
jgi:triacylglycerol lipase